MRRVQAFTSVAPGQSFGGLSVAGVTLFDLMDRATPVQTLLWGHSDDTQEY